MTVYPTLYLQDGAPIELAPVELGPLGSASIEVNATVNALGHTAPAFGGAIFRYRAEHGGRLAVETAVAMPANNILYSVESFTGFEKNSNAQHSAFWLPTSGSEVFFAAFNASDSVVALRPRLHLGGARFDLEEAAVPPKGHFRRRLTAEQLADYARRAGVAGDLVGGVTLEHDGPADAVQATGWIDDRTKSYSNMMSFADPAAGAGPKLYGVQLLLGRQPLLAGPGQPVDLRTRVVLRNMTAGAVTAAAAAYYSRGGAVERAALPGLRLGPFAAADYDLDALQRAGAIPPDVREVLLEVESFAAPGSVMGRAFSVSTDLSYGLYSVLESDGTGFWSGIYWSLKGDENTVMTIANIGGEETTAAVELAYPGGVARLRPLPVRPRETVTLNLRRDLPRLLAEGGRLPPGAESGGYRVRSVEDPLRAELVVKQHVLSASKKTAAPFYGSCAYVTSLWLGGATWPAIDVLVGGTKNITPYCDMSTGGFVGDFGAVIQPDGGGEISIGPQYGYTRTISGLAPGLRDINHSSIVPSPSCGTVLMQGWPASANVLGPQNLSGAVVDWQHMGGDTYHVTLTGPGLGVGVEYGFMSLGQMVQTLPCPIPGPPCAVINGVSVLVRLAISGSAIWELWNIWQERVDSPYGWPGWDGTVAPGADWEWRGPGVPGSAEGNWHRPGTNESLRPDLNHPEPIPPHWDYKDPSSKWWRVWPDGKMTPKKP